MSGRIVWTTAKYGHEGAAGRLNLFGVHWGTRRSDRMWVLSTRLPISSPRLGQHYETPEDAYAAAEKLLTAFIREIGGPA